MVAPIPRWLLALSAGVCCGIGALLSGAASSQGDRQAIAPAETQPAALAVSAPTPVSEPDLAQRLITRPAPIEVARLDDAAFDAALTSDLAALGPLALGRPNRGYLFNGVALEQQSKLFHLEEPEFAYGTVETIEGLKAAVREVHRLFGDTKPLSVGHISRRGGGWLRPHKSHQNGRDVDLGFYYTDDSPWYREASRDNLDVPRTWALITAMERAAGLEYVFVDRSLHDVLRAHAEAIGEPPEFVVYMFEGPLPERGPIIRHARGHKTHLHVRFASPVAVEYAARVARQQSKAGRHAQLAQFFRQGNRQINRQGKVKSRSTRSSSKGAKHAARSTRSPVKAL